VLTPNDTVEQSTETIWRLPRCWVCYQPEQDAPPVAQRDGSESLTFGSFNQLSKMTADVVKVWAQVLLSVPGSRLLLKAQSLGDSAVCADVIESFAREGIAADRLILRPRSMTYLQEYGEVDIALDPFPRTGGVTTMDALWMGVPVVSLAGQRMIERQGVSLLSAVGLEELVASSRGEYIEKAVSLARDGERRQALRGSLRERVRGSVLCDHAGLARSLEEAYRQMWQQWLAA
jgi:protein O-GlcNAc transferase